MLKEAKKEKQQNAQAGPSTPQGRLDTLRLNAPFVTMSSKLYIE